MFMEFLKSGTVKAGLMYFLIFQPEDMLMLCLSFNDSQSIYACKCKSKY